MAAPTITPARAPEAEQSTTPLAEPSMEDILASIRRIIAEDQSQGLARSGLTGLTRRTQTAQTPGVEVKSPAAEAAVAPEPEAFQLGAVEAEPEVAETSQGDALRGSYEADVDSADAAEPNHVETFPPMEAESHHAAAGAGEAVLSAASPFAVRQPEVLVPREAEPLMSPTAGASITSSFQALAESVVLQDPGLVERIMRETMRPLLKEWLDDHLPSIVERLVRAEIERVARGGRSRD